MEKIRQTICSLLTAVAVSFSSSVADAYDKNDNYVTEETVQQMTEPSTMVFVREKVHCDKIRIFGQDEVCQNGREYTFSYANGSNIILSNKIGTKYVLTSDHLLPKENDAFLVRVGDEEGSIEVRVIKRDYVKDLALFLMPKKGSERFSAYQGCFGTSFSLGDFVIGVGYTMLDKSLLEGRIHSIPDRKFLRLTMPLIQGNSGGILYAFDKGSPKVIGVLAVAQFYGNDNIGGAISAEVINEFLQDTPLAYYACKGGVKK